MPAGVDGVKETLKYMVKLTREGKRNFLVRAKAQKLIEGLEQKNWPGEIKALHQFVRDNIRYTKDVRGVETLHSPEKLLEIGQGDCDDKAVLLASMLESIGHPTRFIAMSQRPGAFSHVFVETKIKNKWIPLETTEPVEMGWRPKDIYEMLVAHV